MNSRDWVVQQIRTDPQRSIDKRVVAPIGDNGLVVTRPGRPDAVAYCCERSTIEVITTAVVVRALHELPQTQMIIIFPSSQDIHAGTYEFVRERRLAIGSLNDLNSALHECNDIGTYEEREAKYVRNRITRPPAVTRVLRKGHNLWVLKRSGGLRSLTIVTSEAYEVTDHAFTNAVIQHPALDAYIATSPNVQGFSNRVSASARDTGVKLLTMNEFVRTLRQPWT